MTAHDVFNKMAKVAFATPAITYRTDIIKADGTLETVGNITDTWDDAYDDYVESLKWHDAEALVVWEVSRGMVVDITPNIIYEMETLAEQRG